MLHVLRVAVSGMNGLVRRRSQLLFGGGCKRFLRGVSGSTISVKSGRVAQWPVRFPLGRHFSTTPVASGGISKVPGSGAKDSWSEVDSGIGGPSSDILQGDVLQTVADVAQTGQDLASLGLGSMYTPVGLVQILLDSLHATTGLPWWGTIAVTTVMLRVCLFPLSVKFARNAAKMAKLQPELSEIMKKIQHYSKIGATELQQKEQIKIAELYKAHDCSPLSMMTLPFMQVPFFMSFFIALRKMALAPIESMKTGGVMWAGDLTLPDPTYALPLIACGLFITNIQVCIQCRVFAVYLPVCVWCVVCVVGW